MAIDVEEVRRRNAKQKSNRGGGKTWRCQPGENNVIRVLSFQHKVSKEDIGAGLFPKDKLGKTVEDFERMVVRQFGFTSNNSPIFATEATLEKYNSIKKSKDPQDIKEAKAIKPDTKFAMNIIDMNDPEKGVQLALIPSSIREVIGDHVADEDYGPSMCVGLEGRDWKIVYNKDEDPGKMYKAMISPKPGKKMGSKTQEMVKDLYDPKVYGQFAGEGDDDAEVKVPEGSEEEAGEEEVVKTNGKKSKIFDED
jgi:hypothetical protein